MNNFSQIGKAGSNNGAPNLGVAAEDGYFYTWDLVQNDWEQLLEEIDNSWIEEVSINFCSLSNLNSNTFFRLKGS